MPTTIEQTTPAVEIKTCFNCRTEHDREEMIHCLICDGYACVNCSCNCIPMSEEEAA